MSSNTRNFCIIAHVDHGKSTLADRFLELTGTVAKREMKEQLLDSMDLERERGITIKLAPARMEYKGHILNLIDTPGHVDFHYEVSRSLAAVEGALLLVDATQGIQAQTLANLYLALDQNLAVIPVVNKIDLPAAQPEKTAEEIMNLIGCPREDIIFASGKTGVGVETILQTIIDRVPPPTGEPDAPAQALIFDSHYDDYQGVVASVRIKNGTFKKGDAVTFVGTKAPGIITDLGFWKPHRVPFAELKAGDIGYIAAGLKEISACRVGDTITLTKNKAEPLVGYKEIKPMVFAGIFPVEGDNFENLRKAMEKIQLNDAALQYEAEHSQALGFGFRAGFLGLLHLEIVQERLEREHGIDITVTVPSVAYKITKTSGEDIVIKSPEEWPDASYIAQAFEPWVKVDILTPEQYLGAVMQLVIEYRGRYNNTEYIRSGTEKRAILHYEIPLASILVDFYDKLKSASQGYASLNYELKDYEKAEIVKMDVLVAEEPVEALAMLVPKDEAHEEGKRIVEILKNTLPRQQFELKIQAALGGKIIAAERISAMRKDVTAKLYGGDVTRKRKLLEKQKKGKKRMMEHGTGKVEIPTKAYLAVLKK